jgi:hypothetical protein
VAGPERHEMLKALNIDHTADMMRTAAPHSLAA